MANYYVSPSGRDTNSGTTANSPWVTIEKACQAAGPGDTIYLMPGTHRNRVLVKNTNGCSNGTRTAPITITSYSRNNRAIISAPQYTPQVQIYNRNWWVIDGIEVRNVESAFIKVQATHDADMDMEGITIKNCTLDTMDVSHGRMSGQWGIAFDAGEPSTLSNSHVHNNIIRNLITGYIKPDGTWSFNECITMHHNVHHCTVIGNDIYNSSFLTIDLISKRTYVDSVGATIYGGLVHHIVVAGNRINVVKPDSNGSNNALKIDGAEYVLFENNIVTAADGIVQGAEPWSNYYKNEYRYLIWRNNVVDNVGRGSSLWGAIIGASRGFGNYQSTFMNYTAFVHNTLLIDSGFVFQYMAQKNIRCMNNVLVARGDAGTTHKKDNVPASALSEEGWKFAGNLWHADRATWQWVSGQWYNNWGAYRSAKEPTSHFGNPVFVQDGSYALAPSSPGYERGQHLTTTNGNGSGNTVTVHDSIFFFDGYGMMSGDLIQVGSQQARVTGVNYSNNTLTLDRSISWSNGAPVNYVLSHGTTPTPGRLMTLAGTAPPEPSPIVANAGGNQTVNDDNESGSEPVTLDGSGSYSDVPITAYVWDCDTVVIPDQAVVTVDFPQGVHTVRLTITDSEAKTATDTITVTVRAPEPEPSVSYLQNPCMLNGARNWLLHSSGITQFASISEGGVTVDCTSSGGNTQVSQSGFAVVGGRKARLIFTGSGVNQPTTVTVNVFQNNPPYNLLGFNRDLTLGTEETTHDIEFEFVADEADARVMIWISDGDHFTVKELNIIPLGGVPCYGGGATPPPGGGEPGDQTAPMVAGAMGIGSTGWWDPARTTYNIGDINPTNHDYYGYFRMQLTDDIPSGATISAAHFTVKIDAKVGNPTGLITAETTVNPGPITSHADKQSRTYATHVPWSNFDGWTTTNTPDFSNIIQALLNGADGLSAGDTFNFIIEDAAGNTSENWFAIQGYGAGAPAQLVIEWQTDTLQSYGSQRIRIGERIGERIGTL